MILKQIFSSIFRFPIIHILFVAFIPAPKGIGISAPLCFKIVDFVNNSFVQIAQKWSYVFVKNIRKTTIFLTIKKCFYSHFKIVKKRWGIFQPHLAKRISTFYFFILDYEPAIVAVSSLSLEPSAL